MKNLLMLIVLCVGIGFVSCSKKNCKECTDCITKANATLCEDDFEKTSNYNDELAVMISDGCTCNDK